MIATEFSIQPSRFSTRGRVESSSSSGSDARVLDVAVDPDKWPLAEPVRAGQFFMLRRDGGAFPFVSRPFSALDTDIDSQGRLTRVSFLLKIMGAGTASLAEAPVGSDIQLAGPLGLGFGDPPPQGTIVFVAGGVGIPPILLRAKELGDVARERGLFLFGAANRESLYLLDRVEALGLPVECSTDDGTHGTKGRVDVLLRHALNEGDCAQIMACGPEPMLEAVSRLGDEFDVPALLSLENYMGCGFGVCNSCAVKVREDSYPGGFRYARSCREGPVIDHRKILWS